MAIIICARRGDDDDDPVTVTDGGIFPVFIAVI